MLPHNEGRPVMPEDWDVPDNISEDYYDIEVGERFQAEENGRSVTYTFREAVWLASSNHLHTGRPKTTLLAAIVASAEKRATLSDMDWRVLGQALVGLGVRIDPSSDLPTRDEPSTRMIARSIALSKRRALMTDLDWRDLSELLGALDKQDGGRPPGRFEGAFSLACELAAALAHKQLGEMRAAAERVRLTKKDRCEACRWAIEHVNKFHDWIKFPIEEEKVAMLLKKPAQLRPVETLEQSLQRLKPDGKNGVEAP